MPKTGLTGSRIREQRLLRGVRQGALAKAVGISAPYLNLIEHNRRRIAGKLLNDIARELAVEPTSLSHGAGEGLLAAMLDASAAQRGGMARAETDRAGEMAGRFPGWAGLVAAQRDQIETLERTVTGLSDRMTHDPQLAASLHEVLSVATAIRATSAILARDEDVDADWQARFHRNLFEDAQRLAQSAQGLVEYLDTSETSPNDGALSLPQEDLERWLAARGFHIGALEGAEPADIPRLVADQPGLAVTRATGEIATVYFQRYRDDAVRVPLAELLQCLGDGPLAPLALARHFDCDLACILRRLACLPDAADVPNFGLVICDGSGTLTFRKPLSDFPLPKFGAACPLWPLYQVLSRPMSPLRTVVEQSGLRPARYLTFAIAQPADTGAFNAPTLFEATMLILPETPDDTDTSPVLPIGPTCRICPRAGCEARREPSILAQGF